MVQKSCTSWSGSLCHYLQGFIDYQGGFFAKFPAINRLKPPLWATNLIQAASILKQRWKALHRKRFMTLMAKQDISWRNPGALVIQELPLWNMACSIWTSWWLNPPIWSILYNQIGSFLWRIGVKINNIWNHIPVLGFLCFFLSFLAKWFLLNINHYFHEKTKVQVFKVHLFLGYGILGFLQIFTLISACKLEIHLLLTLSTTTAATDRLRWSKMPKTSSLRLKLKKTCIC